MTEIKTEGNSIVCIFSGVLDGAQYIKISPTELTNKKIQLIGKNITSWNTDFVVNLFNVLYYLFAVAGGNGTPPALGISNPF